MSGKDKAPSPQDAAREAKLAQALRANLRRRKAPPKAVEPPPEGRDKRS